MRYHVKVAAKKKIISTTAIVAGVLMFSSSVDAQTAPHTNSWDYDTVVGGNVGKDTSVAGVTDITVTGGNGYVAGNASIYDGHTVNVTGDTAGSTFAYRDNRDNIQSTLDGNLNSNMNVVIIDRDGLWFTSDSVIDVNGLIATTGDVGKNDLMNGDNVLKIKNINPNSMIINNGQITAKDFAVLAGGHVYNTGTIVTEAGGQILLAAAEQVKMVSGRHGRDRFKIDLREGGHVINTGIMDAGNGGLAAIVSPFAINNGIIRAKAGTVAIAAGETVTLDMYGDGLVELAVDGELADALITNGGAIAAKGGVVNITAKAAKNTVDNLINNEGIITASSATVSGGKIILGGGDSGTIRNAGEIRTSAGGSVDVNGERFLQESASSAPIPPTVPAIKSGGANINIATAGDVVIDAGNVNAQGGNVAITNDGTFTSEANAIRTRGTGTITLTQNEGGQIQNAIDAIKNSGTGENTVKVGAGTYNEAVVADVENLNLRGANAGVSGISIRGAESVIIPNSPGVHVTSDNVTVNGFKIVGGDDGVYVESADNVSIINNIVEDSNDNGIRVVSSANVSIKKNKVSGADENGVSIEGSASAVIARNAVAVSGQDGISVNDSNGAKIVENNVVDSEDDGIDVQGGQNVEIKRNTVSYSGDNGVEVSGGYRTNISGNLIALSDNNGIDVDQGIETDIKRNVVGISQENGIYVNQGQNIDIKKNTVTSSADDGIQVANTLGANINNNIVIGSSDDGIDVENSFGIDIKRNEIEQSGENGIDVYGSGDVEIKRNQVLGSAYNGIKLLDSYGAQINLNIVGFSGDDGIDVDEGFGVDIKRNIVGFSGDDGIDVNESGDVKINRNLVIGAADNGIEVSDSNGTDIKRNAVGFVGNNGISVDGSDELDIIGNIVTQTGGNGIMVSNGNDIFIRTNQISETGDDGIDLNYVEFADVVENEISNAGDDGIDVDYGDDILIAENDVTESNEDGVSINGSGGIFIYNNTISQSGDDGIDVENTGFVDILENTITESEDDGVDIYATSYSIVASNEISDSGDDGVHIAGNGFYPAFFSDERSVARAAFYDSSAIVEGNTIENSGGDGVQVDNLLEATIIENVVNESAEHGLYVSGASNGYVQVQGNEFNDNGDEDFAQARFESGDIDLSDVTNPNVFTKTTAGTGVAMQFDDISGGFSSPSDSFELAFISPFGTGLRIVDETLGSTEFTGYTGAGNFYVRLEDGALLDPLTSDPIVIDGTNASFDGIIPSSFAGTALPLATLQFIEDRLYDADDASVNGRGQIFTGFVETIDGPANFQDFLPFFNNIAPLSNFASVTINGLPSIGNFGGGAGALNNIAPAAGEQNNEQELADIEPSAGGNGAEVTCIEDAVNGLGSGSVTYNFGGSFEDTIAGAVGCQSGEI